ncbi:MAG: PAS domain-containing protein, partial [Candidatus Bipolaricaulis sp.]|nr:PAS domain-containing protein [Candidatus Bipolaricaulis sp.]
MASGLNPTERTIVVIIAFVIAVVLSVALPRAGFPPLPVVGVAFGVPLVLGTWTLRLRAALALSLAICGVSLLLLAVPGALSAGPVAALCAGDLIVGAGIGWLNGRKQSREAKWRHAKAVKERHDKETFEPAINIFHFVDREGTAVRRNEASRGAIGYSTKRSLQLSEYVHPEDMDRMKAELIRLFEREEIRGVKIRFISEERKAFPVELRGTRIGERLAVLEARDRSREDELERRMMETEARYRIL